MMQEIKLNEIVAVPPVPERPADGHKGTFGTVIVIGGSYTMIGAPALVAGAALRSGAGLVKVATSRDILHPILIIEPSATGIIFESVDLIQAVEKLGDADPMEKAVLAVGPGWGKVPTSGRLLEHLLRGPRPMVLDADGLNLLASSGRTRAPAAWPLVLTPHVGEFQRLARPLRIEEDPTIESQRPQAAAKLALAHNAVVALKGQRTIVSDGKNIYVNQTGTPALATAGSGDVLTGLIAGLLAQGMNAMDATVLAVYLHGMCAQEWTQVYGPSSLTAPDLVRRIPSAFAKHRKSFEEHSKSE